MSMESTAWNALYRTTYGTKDSRPFSKVTLKRILVFARPHRRRLAWFLALSVVTAALAVATPVLAGVVISTITDDPTADDAGEPGRIARLVGSLFGDSPLNLIVALAVLIGVIAIAEAGLGLVVRWLSSLIGESVILDLRTAVYDHVQRMPVAFFTRTRTGALVSRLNNDVIGAQRAFSGTLSGVVGNLVTLAITLAVMLYTSWQITLLALVLLPVFVIPARSMGSRLARLQRESANHNATMSTQMTERFSAPGATLVKLFGRPDAESAEFAARASRVRDIGVRSSMLQFVFVTALTLVSALALALVYGLGGWFALTGRLDAGQVVTLALLLTRLYAPLTALSTARVDVMSAIVSFERVFEVLDLEPLIQEKPDARPAPEGPLSVEVDDVRFGYPSAEQVSLASLEEVAVLDSRGGDEVLHGISFTARPGQVVAIVGSSGAGKSTIAQLVARLYDVEHGAVRIGGTDVRDLSFAAMRGAVGVVTQDGHLFHETIRANLVLAAPGASDDQVWSALRRARLERLVRDMPDGLDTVVGERGYRLSGGERQRMTIARLLLAQPRVVVLDEATAALDSTSEAAVQAALDEALEGRTAIVIAHRLSTIRSADVILVLEDGRVVQRGSHEELMRAGGRYEELHRTQFRQDAARVVDGVEAGAGTRSELAGQV